MRQQQPVLALLWMSRDQCSGTWTDRVGTREKAGPGLRAVGVTAGESLDGRL